MPLVSCSKEADQHDLERSTIPRNLELADECFVMPNLY